MMADNEPQGTHQVRSTLIIRKQYMMKGYLFVNFAQYLSLESATWFTTNELEQCKRCKMNVKKAS